MSESPLSTFSLLDTQSWRPQGFTPFGGSPHADLYNRKLFQTLATIIPMATLGYVVRSAMAGTEKDAESLRKTADQSVDTLSPIPNKKKQAPAVKTAGDKTYSVLRLALPVLAAYASFMGGASVADKRITSKAKQKFENSIGDRENQYSEELMKRLYPAQEQEEPDQAVKQAGVISGMASTADALGLLTWAAPVMAALGTGSFIAARNWTDQNSKARQKAKALKASLEKTARLDWVPKVELPGTDSGVLDNPNAK